MTNLITVNELRSIFGATMPMEAMQLLADVPPAWSVEDLRRELRKMAEGSVDIATPPPMQDHRFGEMFKGKRYAYARGLTINPTHLPSALDAMEEDGWELMAIFGETTASKIGFIFRKQKVPVVAVKDLMIGGQING